MPDTKALRSPLGDWLRSALAGIGMGTVVTDLEGRVRETNAVADTLTGWGEGEAVGRDAISFLSDDIIRLRYVEIDGQLRKVLMVVKVRDGDHSKDIREYDITAAGFRIGERITGFHGLITAVPEPLDGEADTAPGVP